MPNKKKAAPAEDPAVPGAPALKPSDARAAVKAKVASAQAETPVENVGQATEAAASAGDDFDPTSMPEPMLDDERPQPPKLKKSSKGPVVVLIILLVAAAAAAGWYFFLRGPSNNQSNQPAANSSTNEETVASDVPDAQNTETFTSDPYRLTLKYPKTWSVSENDDSSLLIQSQDFTYKADDGSEKRGNFRVYIRKGATTADSEIIAVGVAVEPSQTLKYTEPTASQRTETNLTNFGKDAASNFSFMLITSNFNLKAGDTLGPNFGQEVDAFIIGGGYSESSLEPGLATNAVPLDGFNSTNAYKQAVAIIQSLQIN